MPIFGMEMPIYAKLWHGNANLCQTLAWKCQFMPNFGIKMRNFSMKMRNHAKISHKNMKFHISMPNHANFWHGNANLCQTLAWKCQFMPNFGMEMPIYAKLWHKNAKFWHENA